jgi:hypothetical protein
MKKFIAYSIALICLMSGYQMQAHVRAVKSERSFDNTLDNSNFTVVMIYSDGKKHYAGINRDMISRLKNMFNSASQYSIDFKHADVAFVSVDISRKDLSNVADQYNIQKLPTFLLFKDGNLLEDTKTKAPIMLTGFVTRSQLLGFIGKHLQKDIAREAQEWRKNHRYRRTSVSFGFGGAGYPYYYPYGPYYPYYGGPVIGVGF